MVGFVEAFLLAATSVMLTAETSAVKKNSKSLIFESRKLLITILFILYQRIGHFCKQMT